MITNFEEEIKVRSLTASKLGDLLVEQYNKIAILSIKDNYCVALTSTLYSKIIEKGKIAELFYITDLENTISEVINFQPEVICLFIGGGLNKDNVIKKTKEALRLIKESSYDGDLFIHARTYLMTEKLKKVLNSSLKNYLMERTYTFSFDLDKGIMKILYLDLEKEKEEVVREVNLLFLHNELLNKSLLGRIIKFEELQ